MKKLDKKRLLIALTAVVLAVIGFAVFFFLRKDTYRIIKVYEINGTSRVKRGSLEDLEPFANMLLQSGDTVNVDTGTMTLRLDEDKYVYAEENTEFSIEAAGNSKEGRTTIELKKGAIVNEIRQKLGEGSSYEVNTPNATMSVRGTTFQVEVTYDQNGTCYTRITVTDGKVVTRLKYEDGSVAEEEVAVEKDGEVIIYRDSTTTDYVKDIPGENAGENNGNEAAKTDGTDACTVTFMYDGEVFCTQTVQSGTCASMPSLMPEKEGRWDYDFTKPVEQDIVIKWK